MIVIVKCEYVIHLDIEDHMFESMKRRFQKNHSTRKDREVRYEIAIGNHIYYCDHRITKYLRKEYKKNCVKIEAPEDERHTCIIPISDVVEFFLSPKLKKIEDVVVYFCDNEFDLILKICLIDCVTVCRPECDVERLTRTISNVWLNVFGTTNNNNFVINKVGVPIGQQEVSDWDMIHEIGKPIWFSTNLVIVPNKDHFHIPIVEKSQEMGFKIIETEK